MISHLFELDDFLHAVATPEEVPYLLPMDEQTELPISLDAVEKGREHLAGGTPTRRSWRRSKRGCSTSRGAGGCGLAPLALPTGNGERVLGPVSAST